MAIFYSKEEKGNKVTVRYNALLPITYYLTFLFILLIAIPLIAMFFMDNGTDFKNLLRSINMVETPLLYGLVILWVVYLVDSLLIRSEVRQAMKSKGVKIQGSKLSLTNRIVMTYEK